MELNDLGNGVFQDAKNLSYFKVDPNPDEPATQKNPKRLLTIRPSEGKVFSDEISDVQKQIILMHIGKAPRRRTLEEMKQIKADNLARGVENGTDVLFEYPTPDVAYQQFVENPEIQKLVLGSPIVQDMIKNQIQEAMKFYMGGKGAENESVASDAGDGGNGPAGIGAAGSENGDAKPKTGVGRKKNVPGSAKAADSEPTE